MLNSLLSSLNAPIPSKYISEKFCVRSSEQKQQVSKSHFLSQEFVEQVFCACTMFRIYTVCVCTVLESFKTFYTYCSYTIFSPFIIIESIDRFCNFTLRTGFSGCIHIYNKDILFQLCAQRR
jgi:hypothetical protein